MIPEDEMGTLHPTVNEKKVSMTPSEGHKPVTAQAAAGDSGTVLQQVKNRLKVISNFVVDPFDAGSYERFKGELALSTDEVRNLEAIKKQAEEDFATIYNSTPKIEDTAVRDFINNIVSLQKKYFTQLSELDFASDTLDDQIEKLSTTYNKGFETLIVDGTKLSEKFNVSAIHNLIKLNADTIKAFKSDIVNLKKARCIAKNIYKDNVIATACICLGTAMMATAIALTLALGMGTAGIGFAALACFGLIAIAVGRAYARVPIIVDEMTMEYAMTGSPNLSKEIDRLTMPAKKEAQMFTERHKEDREVMFANLQKCSRNSCATLISLIDDNSPKINI